MRQETWIIAPTHLFQHNLGQDNGQLPQTKIQKNQQPQRQCTGPLWSGRPQGEKFLPCPLQACGSSNSPFRCAAAPCVPRAGVQCVFVGGQLPLIERIMTHVAWEAWRSQTYSQSHTEWRRGREVGQPSSPCFGPDLPPQHDGGTTAHWRWGLPSCRSSHGFTCACFLFDSCGL